MGRCRSCRTFGAAFFETGVRRACPTAAKRGTRSTWGSAQEPLRTVEQSRADTCWPPVPAHAPAGSARPVPEHPAAVRTAVRIIRPECLGIAVCRSMSMRPASVPAAIAGYAPPVVCCGDDWPGSRSCECGRSPSGARAVGTAARTPVRRNGHPPPAVAMGVSLVAERDLAIDQGFDAVVADRHAVGVARQVLQSLLRSAERGLRIDDPTLFMIASSRNSCEPPGMGQRGPGPAGTVISPRSYACRRNARSRATGDQGPAREERSRGLQEIQRVPSADSPVRARSRGHADDSSRVCPQVCRTIRLPICAIPDAAGRRRLATASPADSRETEACRSGRDGRPPPGPTRAGR